MSFLWRKLERDGDLAGRPRRRRCWLSSLALRLAARLDSPNGYRWYVRALDWIGGRLAERGL